MDPSLLPNELLRTCEESFQFERSDVFWDSRKHVKGLFTSGSDVIFHIAFV